MDRNSNPGRLNPKRTPTSTLGFHSTICWMHMVLLLQLLLVLLYLSPQWPNLIISPGLPVFSGTSHRVVLELAYTSTCQPQTSFPIFLLREVRLVTWNRPQREYLHHENWKILQIRTFFFPESWLLNVLQHTSGLTAIQVVELWPLTPGASVEVMDSNLKSDQVLNSKAQL